jgi:hypothetical protein
MKGDWFYMYLSYILHSPWLSQAEFIVKNPGKSLGPAIKAAGAAIQAAYAARIIFGR